MVLYSDEKSSVSDLESDLVFDPTQKTAIKKIIRYSINIINGAPGTGFN